MSSTLSNFTAYGTGDNLGGSWPAGLRRNNSESTYKTSQGNTYQIAALDHIHVVQFDDGITTAMTLTLPVIANLPLASRIYFFYVSQSTSGYTLQFVPVTGSGNTVNGNALGVTLTLSGSPQLFIVLAFEQNYLVQPFSLHAGNAAAYPSGVQSEMLYFVSPSPKTTFYPDAPTGILSFFYPNANAMTDLSPFGSTDISTYLTPNVALPLATNVYGFQVNVAGWYHINCQFGAAIQWDSASGQSVWGDIGIFDSTGTMVKHFRSADCPQSYYISTTQYPNMMASQFWNLDVGDIVVFSFSGIGATPVTSTYTSASMTFVYYGPDPSAPPPVLFSALSSARSSSSSSSLAIPIPETLGPVEIPVGTPHPKAALIQQHVASSTASRAASAAASQAASSYSVPQFSLSDMEKLISQALDARASSSSSSSSSSPSGKEPVSKKRKTTGGGGAL